MALLNIRSRINAIVVGLSLLPMGASASTIYQSNFQSGSTAGWSSAATYVDNLGHRVLGTTTGVTLSLGAQPAGTYSIAFDLFILNSWDGSHPSFAGLGGDRFTFAANANTLINATFSNAVDRIEQSYTPGTPMGGPSVAGGTGALAIDNLSIPGIAVDRYRPTFSFLHGGGAMTFTFAAIVNESALYNGFANESFALDDVNVSSPVIVPLPGAAAMGALALPLLVLARRAAKRRN